LPGHRLARWQSLAQRSTVAAAEIKALTTAKWGGRHFGCAGRRRDAGRHVGHRQVQPQRLPELLGEISASMHQQASGVHEASEAAIKIDEALQRNPALEQSAAAAESRRERTLRWPSPMAWPGC
jgi:methyl-accepting chemotaxis protein